MPWRASGLVLAPVLLAVLAASGSVWGAFSGSTTNTGNEVRAVPDFVAPSTGRSVVQKSTGGTPGFVRQGGSYRVFADVTDSGRPSSGTAAVTADLRTLAGSATFALSPGASTAGTEAYSHRSGVQAVGTARAAGTYGYGVTTTDGAGNARTQSDFSVVVDNTAPAPTAVSSANRGAIPGRPEAADTMTFGYSEPVDAISVVPGWSGAAPTNVVVRITNNSLSFSPRRDTLTVYDAANGTELGLGTVDLGRTDYVSANRTFGASGTPSTLSLGDGTVLLTLGTPSGTTTTAAGTGTLSWTPTSTVTDRAGNPVATVAQVESGAADRDF